MRQTGTYNWLILWLAYFLCAIFGILWMKETGHGFYHEFTNGETLSWDWFVYFSYTDLEMMILPIAFILCARKFGWQHIVLSTEFIIFRLLVYADFRYSNNHQYTFVIFKTVILMDILTGVAIAVAGYFLKNKKQ